MTDPTITYTVPEAFQVEQALADRIAVLAAAPVVPGTFEAECVEAGLEAASRAYHRTVHALYPAEPEADRLWEKAKADMDALIAADIASDPSVAWHYVMDA